MSTNIHANKASANFNYNGVSIGVTSDDSSHLNWLEEFLRPQYSKEKAVQERDHEIILETNTEKFAATLKNDPFADGGPINFFSLDHEFETKKQWQIQEEKRTFFDEERRIFYFISPRNSQVHILADGDPIHKRIALLRVVRELTSIHCQRKRNLHIHGSSFCVGDRGVIMTGPRGAGKTSLLLNSLRVKGTRFVTNDRLFVDLESGPTIHGMPTIVKIRSKTLEMFPWLAERMEGAPYEWFRTLQEAVNDSFPQSVLRSNGIPPSISPRQLCELLNIESRGATRFRSLVFPSIDPDAAGIEISPLSPEDGAGRLFEDGLFRTSIPAKAPEAFAQPEWEPFPDEQALKESCLRLGNQVRFYECRLGPAAYESLTELEIFIQRVTQ